MTGRNVDRATLDKLHEECLLAFHSYMMIGDDEMYRQYLAADKAYKEALDRYKAPRLIDYLEKQG